ncbi:gliding motility-associated C-terminal domain-containing protein [Saprospiraceae bacterium]|nr:gliding motility-associated C-terminal domain-containing protein [Saprospiraceae bacterium]
MKLFCTIIALLTCTIAFSQINDCTGAKVVCSSESLDFNPDGAGIQELDFSNQGCLNEGEHSSAWFYFQINEFAPNNVPLAFLIIPENGVNQDYDFALYGPGVNCDDLGAPIRCSYAATSPSTGLSPTASDTSEGSDGDGYVSPILVSPGDGFFLLIDNYSNDGVGFALEWEGNGADYLDCDATPPCAIEIELETNNVCLGANEVIYELELTTATTEYTVLWTSPSGHEDWIDDPNLFEPVFTIPDGYTGDATFTIEVSFTEIDCVGEETFTTTIFPFPSIGEMEDELIYCSDAAVTLLPENSIAMDASITWTNDGEIVGNSLLFETAEGGEYVVQVTENGCPSFDTVVVVKEGVPIDVFSLLDTTDICEGINKGEIFIQDVVGGTAPYTFELNDGQESSDFFFVDLPGGDYQVTVTDVDGCTNEANIVIPEFLDTDFDLGNDTLINLGKFLDITNKLNLNDSDISSTEWTFLNDLLSDDARGVNFQPIDDGLLVFSLVDANGCIYIDSIKVRILVQEQIYIANTITPNNDNTNDVFFIQGGPSVSHVNNLKIYSRWGEKVFETGKTDINDPSVGWDGTHKNETINSAAFVYITEVELINGKKFVLTGDIAVRR